MQPLLRIAAEAPLKEQRLRKKGLWQERELSA